MTGIQELLAFPEAFGKLENMLKPRVPLLMKVRVQVEEAGTRLSLQEARSMEGMGEKAVALAGTDSHESGKYGGRSGGSAAGYICDVSRAKSGGI